MNASSTATQIDPWKAFSGSSARGRLAGVLALDDFEPLARSILPRPIFGYVAGAAETNTSRDDNRLAFQEWKFIPRVLRDVSARDQSVELFGTTYASPFGIAPMGLAALTAFDGDRVLARAAAKAEIPFVLSATSLTPMEKVIAAAPGSWFQAYLPGEDERITALLNRVETAGFKTLVVTVDLPVAGNRENNIRAGFSTPLRPSMRLMWDGMIRPRWLVGTMLRTLISHGMPHFENSFAERGAPLLSSKAARDFSNRAQFSWKHIEKIRDRWKGNLILKGILSPEDAALAKRVGANGLVVSNHGGRQLDCAVAALRVLPSIVREAGEMTVMMDGGIRRGSDVLKALALGAKCVFVGRPFNYAASIDGEAGVLHGIQLLRSEIDRNLAMLGMRRSLDVDRATLVPTA